MTEGERLARKVYGDNLYSAGTPIAQTQYRAVAGTAQLAILRWREEKPAAAALTDYVLAALRTLPGGSAFTVEEARYLVRKLTDGAME